MTSLNDSNKNLFLVNSMEPQLKFFGLFNNKEFAQINKEFIERLVLSGVFNKNDHYKGDVEFLNDYKIDSNGFSQLYSFDIRFSFEDNFYELTDEFIDELFNVCKHYVENVSNYMIENEINNYYYEIKKYLNKKEKIKFLEKNIKKFFLMIIWRILLFLERKILQLSMMLIKTKTYTVMIKIGENILNLI